MDLVKQIQKIRGIEATNICMYVPQNPTDSPKLEFADPLFRRRLSQITKMTIQVLHDLIEKVPEAKEYKQLFVSFRGELKREFTINQALIEDKETLPAAFSLSVFNTPIACASIALQLKAGYSVIYPSKGDFYSAIKIAGAPLFSGAEKKIIFVYADEYIPDEYGIKLEQENYPMAFACILGRDY